MIILGSLLTAEARGAQTTLGGLDLVSGQNVRHVLSGEMKANVLVFLSVKCPCSTSHEALLGDLAGEFGPRGFSFVGIHSNADEPIDESRAHFSKSALGFPVINDPGSLLADQFGALKTPHAFVFSRGKLVFQGGLDNSQVAAKATKHHLREVLAAIDAGKAPETDRARTLGCIIKRP